ncbi:hypothetical protein AGMMS50268_34920 [Spirochaetia bacterium]|nr:hypothetical protein AGMMS50268_34920 [Spirochaetia bacterium]
MKNRSIKFGAFIITLLALGSCLMPDLKPELYFSSPKGTTGGEEASPATPPAPAPAAPPPPAAPPAPAPSIVLYWDTTSAPWTGGEPAVPNQGAVIWPAWNPGGGAVPLSAKAKAVLTNAPAGFDYLQWSFDPPGSPLKGVDGRIKFGAEWSSTAPRPALSPEMSISYDRTGMTMVTIHVWNCNSTGTTRGTASASFTVDVILNP